MAEDQSNARIAEDGTVPGSEGSASTSESGAMNAPAAAAAEAGSPHPDGGQDIVDHAAVDVPIGPAGAAPQWREFYRAIRDAVSDMRSGK